MALYANYKDWGTGNIDKQQELEMVQFYSQQMAQASQTFDKTQGINHPLDFYEEAIKYDFTRQLEIDINEGGADDYSILFYSNKTCN